MNKIVIGISMLALAGCVREPAASSTPVKDYSNLWKTQEPSAAVNLWAGGDPGNPDVQPDMQVIATFNASKWPDSIAHWGRRRMNP